MTKTRALSAVPIASKAKQLKAMWPEIKQKLASGSSHAAILQALNEDGLNLSERTYKSYIYRLRKEQRQHGSVQRAPSATEQEAGASTTSAIAPQAVAPAAPQRPRTFDYDPRGIPDLLK